MQTRDEINRAYLKPEIEDVFEEFVGSNVQDEFERYQQLEDMRIAAMIESIDNNAFKTKFNLQLMIVLEKETSPTPDAVNTDVIQKEYIARSVEEILNDIFKEEYFFDFPEEQEQEVPIIAVTEPVVEEIEQTTVIENVVKQPEIIIEKKELANISFNTEQLRKIWNVYFVDNIKKIKTKFQEFLDSTRSYWNYNFSNAVIAKSSYVALCIFISIPFGIVAAGKMQDPIPRFWGSETVVQEAQPQKQTQSEAKAETQAAQLPAVPQPEQSVQTPKPQNMQIVTPGTGETTASYEDYSTSQAKAEAEQPVYPNTETYEPAYDYSYAYTETSWVEPASGTENNVGAPAVIENIPETNTANPTNIKPADIPKTETPEPVNVTIEEPVQQTKPAMLEPLPSSDAFMRPVSPASPAK